MRKTAVVRLTSAETWPHARSPRLAKQFEQDVKWIPDLGYFVCEHQLQAKPEEA